MRVYGRPRNKDGTYGPWTVVQTDPATGNSSWVFLTALCQALLLNLNESPFYGDVGLPGQQSVIQQVQPDYYVNRMQQRYAQYFATLIIAKDAEAKVPTYNVRVTMFDGTPASVTVQIPQ